MTTRTFRQHGQAYGPGPVTIVATIDGTEVFNGVVPSINEPVPTTPDGMNITTDPLFSWDADMEYEGISAMIITVTGGSVLLKNTVANYSYAIDGPPLVRYPAIGGGEALYLPFYAYVYQDGLVYDPLNNVTMNDVSYERDYINTNDGSVLSGQFSWVIADGVTFAASVNIYAGAL